MRKTFYKSDLTKKEQTNLPIIYLKDLWPQDEFFDEERDCYSFRNNYKEGQKKLNEIYNRFKSFSRADSN